MSPGMTITFVVALAISAVVLFLHRLYRRLVLWWRFRHAREGERRAVALLKRSGYRIIASQVERPSVIRVDGRPFACTVRADFLVQKSGKSYVAEVKTGSLAPDPTHSPTRRQLLEYAMAYPTAGVLLVDAERNAVHSVEFDGLASNIGDRWRRRVVAAGILVAVIALIVSVLLIRLKVIL